MFFVSKANRQMLYARKRSERQLQLRQGEIDRKKREVPEVVLLVENKENH
ncbi:hypothetical protein QUF87_03915 [Lysinibacillus pakistanensis]|nr:hypothetical protein [Lysinibacillus pakistanensis]